MIQLDHNHHPSPLSPHQKNLAEHKILAWSDEQQNHYRPPQTQQKPSSPSPDKSSSLSPPPDETKQNVPAIASRQSTPLSELSPPPDDDDEPSKDEESPKPPSPATRDTPSLDVQSPSVSRAASSASPDSRIILVLELNQELLKVCMEMQAQNVNVSDPRYMAYSTRLQSNLTWLAGAADSRQVAMQLPVMDAPPPPVQSDLHSFPRIQEIYAEMPNIFASLISRQQQSMPGHTPFNSLKRERTEDGGLGDGMPMTKRRDTGESKPMMPPPPSFPMSNGNTQPLSDPGPGPGTPTSGDSMRERTRAAQMRAMQMNQQQMQRQMSPPSAQQQLQQQPNMNPGQPPNAPRMALTPQQLSTMPPQFQQAYQMLQNTSHPFMQQIMNAVPGFMQLPVQQQLQRMIGFQQQLRQQAQAQQQQQQQNQGIGGGPMMNGAGGGNGGFPGPSNPMAGQGQSSPMGMGMDPRSMGSPSIPGMMSSGGGGGGPSGMQGGGGMPGGPNMNQRQFMLMQQQQQARNQAPSQQGFQGQGMGMGVGGGGGMSPQQMAFQQQQERMRMEQERVREQQRMQQQQQQSPSMASPHLSAGSGGVPDSFPALRSNSTIPGIARSTRSPSEGAPSPMTPRMRSSMGQEDFQRMMMQQQQQQQQQQHRQNPMPQNQFSPQQMNWQQQQQQMGGGGFGPGQGMSRPSSGAGYGAASPPSVGPQNNWGVGGMTGGGMGYGFGAGEMDMMGQPRHPAPPNPDMSGMPSDIDFNWT